MFRDNKNRFPKPFSVLNGKASKELFCPVDQLPAQDFARGIGGFPASDISLAVRQQNEQALSNLLSAAQQLQLRGADNKDKSIKEIINDIWPKSAQCPAEIERMSEMLAQYEANATSTVDDVGKQAVKSVDAVSSDVADASVSSK